jgi:hypothetical protein
MCEKESPRVGSGAPAKRRKKQVQKKEITSKKKKGALYKKRKRTGPLVTRTRALHPKKENEVDAHERRGAKK